MSRSVWQKTSATVAFLNGELDAIVFASDGQAVGVGAAQTSRVEAAEVAARKGHSFLGYFIFSLFFFPAALIVAYLVGDRSGPAVA